MDWLSEHLWGVWLGIALTLGVLELLSLDLVLLMLAAGALVGMGADLLGLPLVAQVLLAAGSAAAALMLVRPTFVKRLETGPELRLGAAKLVGLQGVVVEPMSPGQLGRIKVDGEMWTAKPYDETLTVEAGESVEVFQIDGATALVHPVPRLGA